MFSFPLHVRHITCQMCAKTRQGLIISVLRRFAKIGSVQLFDSGVKIVYTTPPIRLESVLRREMRKIHKDSITGLFVTFCYNMAAKCDANS